MDVIAVAERISVHLFEFLSFVKLSLLKIVFCSVLSCPARPVLALAALGVIGHVGSKLLIRQFALELVDDLISLCVFLMPLCLRRFHTRESLNKITKHVERNPINLHPGLVSQLAPSHPHAEAPMQASCLQVTRSSAVSVLPITWSSP